MELINKYQNGPVTVEIYDDGTKIREWDDEKYGIEPELEFAESLDIKCTNFCDMNCAWCHEKSSTLGKHGNLTKFMDIIEKSNLPKGVEMAIGGGNPLDHPEIWQFLRFCQNKGIIINMTVNLNHLCQTTYHARMVRFIQQKLVKGIGISITNNTFINKEALDTLTVFSKLSNNIVLHIIEGINDYKVFDNRLFDWVNKNHISPKVLILGKKDFGRYANFSKEQQEIDNRKTIEWEKNICRFIRRVSKVNGVVSFDNLAIERLKLLSKLPEKVVSQNYMGADGTYRGYCDLVEWKFAKQSTSPMDKRYDIGDLSLRDIYKKIYNIRKD